MSEIGPVYGGAGHLAARGDALSKGRSTGVRTLTAERQAAMAAHDDRVELSAARAGAPESGPARSTPSDERIAEVRAQIANGTYLTPEKIDAVVEALYRLLGADDGAEPQHPAAPRDPSL